MADPKTKPSFSPWQKWGIGLHVVLIVLLVLAVVVMVNYLSREYFYRKHLSSHTRLPLSSRTVKLLESITNNVKVTIYYDREEPLFSMVSDLINEYRMKNTKISVRVVDYVRDAGASLELTERYPFLAAGAKNLIIFDCEGRVKPIDGNALTKYVLEAVPNPKEQEYRRKPTAFAGERAFTAALLEVTSPKRLKAYFLLGHGEHDIESGDQSVGYLKFSAVLQQNYIQVQKLSLLGTNEVPADCNLLVVAGPQGRLDDFELAKIDRYLNEGGRMMVMFSFLSLDRGSTGLEQILNKWGVEVGTNVVRDLENTITGKDIKVGIFSRNHELVNPLLGLRLHMILPRPVAKVEGRPQAPDAPRVEEVAFSGEKSDLPAVKGIAPKSYPLVTVVEKGTIKEVITERGTTRIVAIGDSFLFTNHQIDSAANRDFAAYAANWLLDRTQLLEGVDQKPIIEFKLTMTRSQLHQTRLLLLAVLPGSVLVLGSLVWFRRRR